MRWPKRNEIPGVILVIILAAVFIYWSVWRPNYRGPTGFGPDWVCSGSGRGGPDFCLKKSLLQNAGKTTGAPSNPAKDRKTKTEDWNE